MEANSNGFQTVDCLRGANAADKTIPVNSAAYTPARYTATLGVNGGTPLPVGSYRLYVCGTTSITDPAGTKLNNGLSDTEINFTVITIGGTSGGGGEGGNSQGTLTGKYGIPLTGFPQGKITKLPEQPASKAYDAFNNELMLEIPSLGLKLLIIGVPLNDDGWDVSWLGNNAGYLNGTAFPAWTGNSVSTAHVWDANNNPGPFAKLRALKYGDKIKIHAWGQVYTYVLQENTLLNPSDLKSLTTHEDKSWITLVTCEDYSMQSSKYSYRCAVRAVLVSVRKEIGTIGGKK